MIDVLLLSSLLVVADTGKDAGAAWYRTWRSERSGIRSGHESDLTAPPEPVRGSTVTMQTDRWFGEDKLKHFAFSYVITAGTASAARVHFGRSESAALGAALGIASGVAKEIYDRRRGGAASVRDLIWDAAGVGAAFLVLQQAR